MDSVKNTIYRKSAKLTILNSLLVWLWPWSWSTARDHIYGLGHGNGHGLEVSWVNKGVAGEVWNGLVLFIFPSIV